MTALFPEDFVTFFTSTLKIVIGLAAFASLMMLEFNSYTRAVAEEVTDPVVMNLQTTPVAPQAIVVKRPSRSIR